MSTLTNLLVTGIVSIFLTVTSCGKNSAHDIAGGELPDASVPDSGPCTPVIITKCYVLNRVWPTHHFHHKNCHKKHKVRRVEVECE